MSASSALAAFGEWFRSARDPATDRAADRGADEDEELEWREAAARKRYGATTARGAGLHVCPACGLLSGRVDDEAAGRDATEATVGADDRPAADAATNRESIALECPRCGEALHVRKPASVARTWALIVSAFILYIPANVFPITDSRTLFDDQTDTIFTGVVYLWKAGSWPLALLVFFASITVPLAKLIVLTGLTISVQRRTLRKPAQRTRLYRIVEFIGRWSMLDIFAVAILTALVQLKSLAQITVGPGVLAFGAVCVLTILASHSFDPRLIWDPFDASDADPDLEDD